MRQMTEVSFESDQSVVFEQGQAIWPPEQTNRRQQKCEHAKTIQIRPGEAKAAANRKKRGNKRERRETQEKKKKKKGEREIQQRKKEKEKETVVE